MKIAITGHRPNKLGNDYNLTSPLIHSIRDRIVEILYEQGALVIGSDFTLITGMALGIDTLFAKIAVGLKIPFIAAIPFRGQHKKWSASSIKTYMDLLEKAEEIYIVDEKIHMKVSANGTPKVLHDYLDRTDKYSIDKMQKRNEWMVDNCDLLIAVWNEDKSGGTYNCIQYAKSVNKEVIYVNPTLCHIS